MLGIVMILLKHGADPNTRSSRGDTPSMVAAFRGQTEIVRALLTNGADPRFRRPRWCIGPDRSKS